MKIRHTKSVAFFIAAIFSFITVFGGTTLVKADTEQSYVKKESINNPQGRIIGELVEKREANVKYFRKDDGTFLARIYSKPVHYLDEGKWKDIDNTLKNEFSNDNGEILENSYNDFKVRFSKIVSSKSIIQMGYDNYNVSWSVVDALNDSKLKQNVISTNKDELKEENIYDINKNSSSVTYEEIFKDIDLQYNLISNSLKENIIIKQRTNKSEFKFLVNTKAVKLKLNDDKSISFNDLKNEKKQIFKMDPLFMYDSNNSMSKDIDISLEEVKEGYIINIKPNMEWLGDSSRKFPIVIDPSVTQTVIGSSQNSADFQDYTIIEYGQGSGNPYLSNYLRVGYDSVEKVTYKTYIQFKLPQINSSAIITDAQLRMYSNRQYVSGTRINAHKVLSSWSDNSFSYTNQPAIDSNILSTSIGHYGYIRGDELKWNITSVVKKWFNGETNNGIMLKNNNSADPFIEFMSTENGQTSSISQPCVDITYVDAAGLQDYWSYEVLDNGMNGKGYVNKSNGELTYVYNDASISGNRLPINISHVYNLNNWSKDSGYGYGWKLNLDQTISYSPPLAYGFYEYTDEDGSRHYFKQDSQGNYLDDSGLNLKLKVDNTKEDDRYVITSDSGEILSFNKDGKLKNIKDSNNNAITLNWTNNGVYRLSSITDAVGRVYKFDYDTNNRLSVLTEPSGRKTTYIYNSNSQLQKILYSDNTYVSFAYDTTTTKFKNLLNNVLDVNGTGVLFSYYNYLSPKVSTSKKTSYGPSQQNMSYQYNNNVTTINDFYFGLTKIQFDEFGNPVNEITNDNYGQYYEYISDGNSKNKLSYTSKIQSAIKNIIKNSNFEINNSGFIDEWSYINAVNSLGTGTLDGGTKYLGNKALKISKTNSYDRSYFQQKLTLAKGKTYTLSGFIKTDSISSLNSKGAHLLVQFQDKNGNWLDSSSAYISSTNSSWERVEVTFTVPQDALSADVNVCPSITGETGNAYFDCLQLEEGKVVNRYNMVENSSFDYNLFAWTESQGLATNDLPTSYDSRTTFNINGDINVSKSLSQNINLSGDATTPIVIGAWAKAFSLPNPNYNDFGISVTFNKLDGTKQQVGIPFNYLSNDWQFISKDVKADGPFNGVTVTIHYNNANQAYFDSVQLYVDDFSRKFKYDESGRLTQETDLDGSTKNYGYNANNDLISIIDSLNNTNSAIYDDKHNLTNTNSAGGVATTYSYDSYGNILSTRTGNDTLFLQNTNTYYSNGNYIKSTTDTLGNNTSYDYNENSGLLNSLTDSNGNVTSYSYDSKDRITSVNKFVQGRNITNNYVFTKDRLNTISQNGVNYNYQYDLLGNVSAISVGSQKLIDIYSYDENYIKTTFSNGQYTQLNLDKNKNLKSKQYNGSDIAQYEYNSQGSLGYKSDLINGVNYRYTYDLAGNLVKIADSQGNLTSFSNNLDTNTISEKIGNKKFDTSYTVDKDGNVKSIDYSRDTINKISYGYDILGRLTNSIVNTGNTNFSTSYTFKPGVNGASSNTIVSINNNGSITNYTYDKLGNIETITSNGKVIKYYYNELNEIIREDNSILNKTIVYNYDDGGNILTKNEYAYTTGTLGTITTTVNYGYDDANWKDKLTIYNGNQITYDTVGNPLSYNGYNYTWEGGRQLKSINGNGQNISFKYDDNNIRTEKTVNGVTTKYHLVDDRVTYETNGVDSIYYTYDSSNKLVSMNLNGVEYYYIRNAQGDIIGLFDKTGAQVVSYVYDSWGKLISTTGTLASSVGVKNPYRYREYRYDTETGLYYLASRYYNPEWCRFINADDFQILNLSQGELLSHNLFSYCVNNPVMNSDPNGFFAMRTDDIKNIIDTIIMLIPALKTLNILFKTLRSGGKLSQVLSGYWMTMFTIAVEKVVSRIGLKRYIASSIIAIINNTLSIWTGITVGSLIVYGLKKIFRTVTWKVPKYWYWGPMVDTEFIVFW